MAYYIGLDIGTSSVGWAVMDENYHLMKKHGKDMWGIREFDEAETAEARRTFRVSRRRRQREVARIGLLKDYFHDELAKVDPNLNLIRIHLTSERLNVSIILKGTTDRRLVLKYVSYKNNRQVFSGPGGYFCVLESRKPRE